MLIAALMLKKQFKLSTDEERFLELIQAISSMYGLYNNLINLQKMASSFKTLEECICDQSMDKLREKVLTIC